VAAVIGSALAALSSVAPWSGGPDLPLGLDEPRLGFDIPFLSLLELDPGPEILSVGLVVAVMAVLGLLASLIAPLSLVRRLLGILVIAVAVLFGVEMVRSFLDTGEPVDLAFRVGAGPYVALIGGLLMVFGRGRRKTPRLTPAEPTGQPAGPPAATPTGPDLGFGPQEGAPTPARAEVAETGATGAPRPEASAPPPSGPIQPAAFTPTHRVPAAGLPSWTGPDPSAEVGPTLEAGLPLQVVERRAAWAQVRASNGWTGWVDARKLELPPS
jgi:Bacterial SH3 domain